ncbi:MAG: hypothetical protein HZA54_06800, partial [Planctomycetes bacterium]|nr:hypothetical protein [Planctomycetota bacterium]
MSERTAADRVNFDDYGRNYAETLNRSLAPTGETVEYFARGRVAWLAARLAGFGPAARPRRVIDFGCGTGNAVPWLRSLLGADEI